MHREVRPDENMVKIAHTMHMITPGGGMRYHKPSHRTNHNPNPKI